MAEAVTQIIERNVDLSVQQPFYIPMTGPETRPRRSLKHDDTFIVLDSHGDIGASAGGTDGLFHADTRYLARLQLVFDDMQPLLLGSSLRDDNSSLTIDLTNPDVYQQGRLVLEKDMLHIVRTIFLWRGTAYQRIGLQNHGERCCLETLTSPCCSTMTLPIFSKCAARSASAAASARPSCSGRPKSLSINPGSTMRRGCRRCISIRGQTLGLSS